MPAQLHAFIPAAMCVLCRLVCVRVHVLELHIYYQFTFSSRDLAFLLVCQLAATACMSRESSVYTAPLFQTHTTNCSVHSAFGVDFVQLLDRISQG